MKAAFYTITENLGMANANLKSSNDQNSYCDTLEETTKKVNDRTASYRMGLTIKSKYSKALFSGHYSKSAECGFKGTQNFIEYDT